MKFLETEIPGCFLLESFNHSDKRGGFVKAYNSKFYQTNAFDFHIKEIYYTWSSPGVFRGFHFQLPPDEHSKIVFCNYGSVRDFVIDLRKDSKVYGKLFEFELSDSNRRAILIPKGCAHGFFVPEKDSMLTYLVETEYSPDNDTGIHWSSFKNELYISNPIISERDQGFLKFKSFNSPF